MLKEKAQHFLRSVGLYERARSSLVYDWYWLIADRQLLMDRIAEVQFYRHVLHGFQKGDTIFDIGANEGNKTDIFLRLGAQVVAVDPDKANQEILRRRFLNLRLAPRPVRVVGSAVSEDVEAKSMWIEAPGSAKNTLSQKWVNALRNDSTRFGHPLTFASQRQVETTTLTNLISIYGLPFFVKIDVEGYEPNVLRGLKAPVPYLSFEVNLPEFKPEGLECIQVLKDLDADGEFNYAVDCRQGLVLEQWTRGQDFARLFDRFTEPSVEVFWRTPMRRTR